MTRIDLFDDLDPASPQDLKAALAGRVAVQARALREERVILYAGANILIAGDNFGCGSSREHAPISLGAAGCKAVLAGSFARIFFRNCIATGEVYPIELNEDLTKELETGDEVEVDLEAMTISVMKTGMVFELNPLGDVREVIDAGGIFEFARKTGMIA